MKGAIANAEIFVSEVGTRPRRLSLVIGAPERNPTGEGWRCRVALADLYAPTSVSGTDSFDALSAAFAQAREWLTELRSQGRRLSRDRDGKRPFEIP